MSDVLTTVVDSLNNVVTTLTDGLNEVIGGSADLSSNLTGTEGENGGGTGDGDDAANGAA